MKIYRKRDNFDEQRATSNEQRATSNEQRATSNEQRATSLSYSPEFDQYAENYSELINASLKAALKGNPREYFSSYKIYHLKKIFASQKINASSKLKVLDYGCGVGLFSRELFEAVPDIILHGFDVSGESIKRVPKDVRVGSNIFTSSLNELDNDYDTALLVTVLHHVLPVNERRDVVRNIHSRLRPGGKLIIIEHNMRNPLTRKVVMNSEVDKEAVMLAPEECSTLLSDAGFQDITTKYIIFFPKQLGQLKFLDKYISWLPYGAQFMTCGVRR